MKSFTTTIDWHPRISTSHLSHLRGHGRWERERSGHGGHIPDREEGEASRRHLRGAAHHAKQLGQSLVLGDGAGHVDGGRTEELRQGVGAVYLISQGGDGVGREVCRMRGRG